MFTLLSFCPTTDCIIRSGSENQPALDIQYADGQLCCKVYADFCPQPLVLRANVQVQDDVSLRLMPHRIELAVNGHVTDEEWPAGTLLFDPQEPLCANVPVNVAPYEEDPALPPDVLDTFPNAEGWRPEENVFVGDCMPYTHDGRYHVLYLKDRHHHQSKWKFGAHQWSHISSADLKEWAVHPMAVAITHPWEGSICTGSWIQNRQTHYLFYTIRMTDHSPAPIRRSISQDGYHYEKDESFSFTLPSCYHGPSARDPKVIQDENGLYHMLLTTTLLLQDKGCLAHLVSPDLDHWTDVGPLYISPDQSQPECPDYIHLGDYYYLIYSLHGRAHYLYSRSPFDGWQTPAQPVIPCQRVPKGAVWQNKILFTGFQTLPDRPGYAGVMTFSWAEQGPDGELIFV